MLRCPSCGSDKIAIEWTSVVVLYASEDKATDLVVGGWTSSPPFQLHCPYDSYVALDSQEHSDFIDAVYEALGEDTTLRYDDSYTLPL